MDCFSSSYFLKEIKEEVILPTPKMEGNIGSYREKSLTSFDLKLYSDFTEGLPSYGVNWPSSIKFPKSCDSGNDDVAAAAYISPKEMHISCKVLGYPKPNEYPDDLCPASDAERARLGMMAHIIASIQITLSWLFMRTEHSNEIEDIFKALKDPKQVEFISPVAVYIYAGVRNELIIPLFGSINSFYCHFIRLRKVSTGFVGGLKSLQYKKVLEHQARKLFEPDDVFQSFITLFVSLTPYQPDMMHILSSAICCGTFSPEAGKNPAEYVESDPVIELVLGQHSK